MVTQSTMRKMTPSNITPEKGMGATIILWSDRHACTIIDVPNPKRVVVREDLAIRTDSNGVSECQEYRYETNPQGKISTFTLRKNGKWVQQGKSMKNGTQLGIGFRREYYDYSF